MEQFVAMSVLNHPEKYILVGKFSVATAKNATFMQMSLFRRLACLGKRQVQWRHGRYSNNCNIHGRDFPSLFDIQKKGMTWPTEVYLGVRNYEFGDYWARVLRCPKVPL